LTRKHAWHFVLPAVLLFALDQGSKAVVDRSMILGISKPILGHVLRLSYVRNSGAAFGILSGSGFPFALVSTIAMILLLAYFVKKVRRSGFRTVSLGLIMGGALGNLIDRLRLGEVVDFVDVGWHHWRWPVFNVADAGVTVGFLLLIASLSFGPDPNAPEERPSESGA